MACRSPALSDSGPRAVNAIDEPRLVITYDRNEQIELVEVAYGRGAGRQVPASFVQWSRCGWPSLRKSDSLRHCGFRSQQAVHQLVSPRVGQDLEHARNDLPWVPVAIRLSHVNDRETGDWERNRVRRWVQVSARSPGH